MTSPERDVREVHSLYGQCLTWREVAQAAIHRLAAREAEYEALQVRYGRLLDEYRVLRQQRQDRAA